MIKNTPDPAVRLNLLNTFVKNLSPGESASWAYMQIFQIYQDAGQLDRALETGEKALALNSRDVELAYRSLKAAEQKGDPVLVRKWSGIAAKAVAGVVSSPGDAAATGRLAYARQLRTNLGYAEYREILGTPDAPKKLAMIEDFLRRNKESDYRHAAENLYLATCRAAGDARKTLAAAERILKLDENNEDALMILAESYRQSDKDPAAIISYGSRVLSILQGPKPIELTGSDWDHKKALLTGHAYWLIGGAFLQQNRFSQADKSIRAALPYLKGDSRMTSAALFYLGWANYQMHNYGDAMRFNQQCLLIKGPYQEQAARNIEVIRSEASSQ